MRLPPPDPLTTILLYVTAIFMAVNQALSGPSTLTAKFPALKMGGDWNYVPIALLAVATVVWIVQGSKRSPVTAPKPVAEPRLETATPKPVTTIQAIPFKRVEPALPPPLLNAALTATYLNNIVAGSTALEAKRKLAEHSNQLAKLRGQVFTVKELSFGSIYVEMGGLAVKYGVDKLDTITMVFRSDQADEMAVIKPGDWIEFAGRVQHGGEFGWQLVDCEFIARADPPKPKRQRKAKT